jgi:hypothetical protein
VVASGGAYPLTQALSVRERELGVNDALGGGPFDRLRMMDTGPYGIKGLPGRIDDLDRFGVSMEEVGGDAL